MEARLIILGNKGRGHMRNWLVIIDPFHIFIAIALSLIVVDVCSLFSGRTISLGMMLMQFAIPTICALIVADGRKLLKL